MAPIRQEKETADHYSGWPVFLVLSFLLVFTARAWLVERYAASVAMVDEWDATGAEILVPWHEGKLTASALFQAHNGDHRIVATRLTEIACFVANGSWDPKLVLTVKAAIYAVAATLFIHLLAAKIPKRRTLAAILLCLLFAFPFDYQNLVWAFQSQFDFFLLAIAVGWTALLSNRCGLALAAAFFALFTLGAGPVLAMSYVPFLFWKGQSGETPWRKAAWTMAIAGIIVVLGLALRTGHAAPIGPPSQQLVTLNAALAWPYSNLLAQITSSRTVQLIPAALRNFPSEGNSLILGMAGFIGRHPSVLGIMDAILAAFILLPSFALGGSLFKSKSLPGPTRGPLAIAVFGLLMTIATAIARAGETAIAVRYLDLVCLVGFSSIAAAFTLYQVRPRRWILGWALVMLPGYFAIMCGTIAKLDQRMPAYWLANLQSYFPAHNHALLADNQNCYWPILENASVPEFMAFLDDPKTVAILPHSLTQPMAPLPWAAATAESVRRVSPFICLIALALMLWIAVPREFLPRRGAAPSNSARKIIARASAAF